MSDFHAGEDNGAKPFQEAVSAKPSPLIIVGPSVYFELRPYRSKDSI